MHDNIPIKSKVKMSTLLFIKFGLVTPHIATGSSCEEKQFVMMRSSCNKYTL